MERGEAVANPFARVKTYAKTHHDVNETLKVPKPRHDDLFSGSEGGSRAGTPGAVSGTNTPKKEGSTPNADPLPVKLMVLESDGKKKSPFAGPRMCYDDEIIGAMDFGIDIDIFT